MQPSLSPTPTPSIEDIESQSFFESIAPTLAISDHVSVPSYSMAGAPAWSSRAGYVVLPAALGHERLAPVAAAIHELTARGLPPIFAYVYDALWEPAAALHAYAERVLGPCHLLADGWAWLVPAGPEHGGWSPHRDARETHDEKEKTRMITVWVAVTDTNLATACIHLVPLDRDPAYAAGTLDDDSAVEMAIPLEVSKGSAILWDARTLHWGGRSSEAALGPRISFSYTFAAARKIPSDKPTSRVGSARSAIPRAHRWERAPLDLARFSFKDRLDVIASMIFRYEHREQMPPLLDKWAKMLMGLRALR